jgi:mannose-1-phosphate guanylyltransferase
MQSEAKTWALVLAAGEGTRLRSLTTTPSGAAIPKQYCSLRNGPSLLEEALQRARAVASNAHTCVVVAKQHRRWSEPQLQSLPIENRIEQPENRGTANGILLPLLHILERDPGAEVVLFPSDQHVREEAVLARALREAVAQLRRRSDEIVLLGLTPEEADPELGYIVPGEADTQGAWEVLQFVEKPTVSRARELIARGGLLNSFIMASAGQTLLALFRRRIPEIVTAMRSAVRRDLTSCAEPRATARLYAQLPTIDFSRDILPGQEAYLRVLRVPQCGWSDLGTPQRVACALRAAPERETDIDSADELDRWSLAAQHERLQGAVGSGREAC